MTMAERVVPVDIIRTELDSWPVIRIVFSGPLSAQDRHTFETLIKAWGENLYRKGKLDYFDPPDLFSWSPYVMYVEILASIPLENIQADIEILSLLIAEYLPQCVHIHVS
ncbi:hypothetical protein A3F32_01070 [Candidatus Roizmanbacteria bacterium RIFCSPHIGHO2_12_FULL_42_10]|uniref:Uncharacterized protein n=1 Tax=Candidatus Roizmanbacteria bacterium RIFCSPHIGHO2_12_FULL_42_10 TaxID=1802053 RepID=A0A1F7I4X2_9BACT|nr:MAG: hypothetical protein A3F32_01070 [Candidatus Roizmanbacteria bacterium RIFCSPHIGHO2_12_FULL_42_10]